MIKKLWYSYFGIYLLFASSYKIKARFLRKRSQEEADEYILKKTQKLSKHILKKSKTITEVEGIENIPEEPCVFISNHQAIFDGFMLTAFINKSTGFIAKKEIKKIPLVSSWLSDMHSIFIDRKNIKESLRAINEGVENIKKGYSMVIFPEGTRSLKSEMGEFKKGSFKLATKAGAPIVPITLDGTYNVLEVGNQVTGNKIKMVIHKPIYLDTLSREEIRELPKTVHEIIYKELKKISSEG